MAGRGDAVAAPPPGTTVEPADADVMIKPDGMREGAATYLAGPDPRHPYASPLYADPHGMPPVLIHVGDAEMIFDDSTRFAAKARAAGTDVTLEVWDQMPAMASHA